jgi:hypothetical protein
LSARRKDSRRSMMRDQRIHVVDCSYRLRGDRAHHSVDLAGVERAQGTLEPLDRLLGPGVHRAVKDNVANTLRQSAGHHSVQYWKR